jgi:hypothetical protein
MPPQSIATGTYVTFNYKATDGTTVSNQATVKIQISCTCHGAAPDVNVCLGTPITSAYLISQGAGCIGCRDATPKFDLSKIPAAPTAGQCYPYTVTCPSCAVVTGHVCFSAPCTITSKPFSVCSGVAPTEADIKAKGSVTCSCDTSPAISGIHLVDNYYEYTITCQSKCGPATATGIVNIEAPCEVTAVGFSIPTETCLNHDVPTSEYIIDSGAASCGCGAKPEITNIHWTSQPNDVSQWVGEYTVTCTSSTGCAVSETSQFISADCLFDCGNLDCSDTNPCTDDSCNPGTGCVHTNNDANTCSDNNACTQTDSCVAGVCTGTNPVTCEATDVCHEAGTCAPATGKCSNPAAPDGTTCTDGNACTQTDTCQAGVCTGDDLKECTASDQCHTAGVCEKATGECTDPVKPNGATCNDGDACTVGDVCANGDCTPGTSTLKCDDKNLCTDDSCVPATGCVYSPNSESCDDGNACTENDVCAGGKCTSGTPLSCEDGNICTTDSCNQATGCVHAANTAPCDDLNACTVGDVCANKVCKPGTTALNCDDTNKCTTDSCDKDDGCQHVSKVCDDGVDCTDDSCNPTTGYCVYNPNNARCGDGIACTNDACVKDCSNKYHCENTNNCVSGDKKTCCGATGLCVKKCSECTQTNTCLT